MHWFDRAIKPQHKQTKPYFMWGFCFANLISLPYQVTVGYIDQRLFFKLYRCHNIMTCGSIFRLVRILYDIRYPYVSFFKNFTISLLRTNRYWWDTGPWSSGPSCSKLTTSLVNNSLKFTSSDTQICWNFFAEKMWVAFAVQKLLTFFQQKISEYCILNLLKQLTKWPLTSSLS